ncbi:MAG: antitoxin [Actinomycetota bacterium]|nr:antitoxin [Actinomycetota bacterium]
MPRTTLDIDAVVLRELKRRQQSESKTLGQLASELLAVALGHDAADEKLPPLRWTSEPLGLKVALEDKEALWRILDGR